MKTPYKMIPIKCGMPECPAQAEVQVTFGDNCVPFENFCSQHGRELVDRLNKSWNPDPIDRQFEDDYMEYNG